MFFLKYFWQIACAALLVLWVFFAVSNSNLRSTLAKERGEWQLERAKAKKAKDDAETKAKQAANDAQEAYEKLSQNTGAVDAYIDRNRVQACPAPARTIKSNAASVPQVAPADPIVAISEPDIRACDGAYVYAKSAYDFGQELMAKGLAQ